MARRLLKEGIDVHDPSRLRMYPKHVHKDISLIEMDWWISQKKQLGAKTMEETFEKVDLKKYKEFSAKLNSSFDDKALKLSSKVDDLTQLKGTMGLSPKGSVFSHKAVTKWKAGRVDRLKDLIKKLGMSVGVLATMASLANLADAADERDRVLNRLENLAYSQHRVGDQAEIERRVMDLADALYQLFDKLGADQTFNANMLRKLYLDSVAY